MTVWHLDVDRIRVMGAAVKGLGASELRALVERAVRAALETAPLPGGRAVTASVRVNVPSLASGAEIARGVAGGVSQALGGRTRG